MERTLVLALADASDDIRGACKLVPERVFAGEAGILYHAYWSTPEKALADAVRVKAIHDGWTVIVNQEIS